MKNKSYLLPLCALACQSPAAISNENDQTAAVERISIIGTQQQLDSASGSMSLIDESDLTQFEYDDIGQVLSRVPGVNIRQEDGFGLRPNIGFRGVTPERSKKINILEDGVLIGPAPYSAPAAYYFPMVTAMTAIEVIKGAQTIEYGPNTVAGAINLVTRDIPLVASAEIDLAGGSDGYRKAHGYWGNTSGKHGVLVEAVDLRSDGFKYLDNGADTGFDKQYLMAKYQYDLSSQAFEQRIQLKAAMSQETSNETYLGLSDNDFAATPYRRYAASQQDQMNWDHQQLLVTHYIGGDTFDITTRIYNNELDRAWDKINGFSSSLGESTPTLLEVVTRPNDERYQRFYQVLSGQSDSSIREKITLGNNDRSYYSRGVEMDVSVVLTLFNINHGLNFGLRFHQDEIQRNHTEKNYLMHSGQLVDAGETTLAASTNTESTEAVSVYVSDTIHMDDLSVTAGVRGEYIDGQYQNRAPGREQDFQLKTTRIWLPSISVHYQLDKIHGLFAGFHQGFVPTSPIQSVNIEVEKSNNLELGWRRITPDTRIELIGFFNDYANLIESCSISAGCDTDITFEAGEVNVFGLEASFESELDLSQQISLPFYITYTYTQSEFQSGFYSDFAQWGYVEQGDSVPYLADNMLNAGISYQGEHFAMALSASYADAMPEAAQQVLTGNDNDSTLTGKQTDSFFSADLSASYRFNADTKMYVKVTNIFDEIAVISRRPYGARPNLSRQFQVGYKYTF